MRKSVTLACWLCLLAALAAYVLTGESSSARADWPPDESKGPIDYSDPKNWPNDPGFSGMWEMWSFRMSMASRTNW